MTKGSQVGFAEVFVEKNANRKAAKEQFGPQYRNGRDNRKALAWHGAFGKEEGPTYNECSMGTLGGRTKRDNRPDERD